MRRAGTGGAGRRQDEGENERGAAASTRGGEDERDWRGKIKGEKKEKREEGGKDKDKGGRAIS